MKWPPSEFWASTPYDCLLAAKAMAKIHGDDSNTSKLNKKDVAEFQKIFKEHGLTGDGKN